MTATETNDGKGSAGRRFGGYQILERVGKQGGVQVYQARQIAMDRTVQLVILPAAEGRKEAYRVRFERKVAIVSSIHHPNVLRAIEAGEIAGHRFVATEDTTGRTLADALAFGRKFDVDASLRIVKEIASALERFESEGFVHRQVSPHAIVLTDAGVAKLAGFTRAKRKQQGGSETWFELDSEEAYYSPPERMKGGGELDLRGDLYALGCVLYELLTGRPPFRGSSAAVLASHAKDQPAPMNSGTTPIPIAAVNVTFNCLKKSRAERYQHAAELVRDLDLALRGQPVALLGAVTVSKPKRRTGLFRRRG